MNLADERLKGLEDPALTADGRAALRCSVAADLIHTGQYEAAREALGELWRGIGARPHVEGLGERAAAEVLLQAGALSGWMGESRRASGAQKAAKDLIGESAALFERLGETDKAAEARSNLAVCFWREGAYTEARAILQEADTQAGDDELKAKIVLRLIVVESSAGHFTDAHRLLTDSAPLFSKSENHALRGRFHNELAIVLRRLGTAEGRADYFDTAIIEYTAAIYHYEQAGHERYKATNENNLAFLLYKLGRHTEAHKHLERARRVLVRLRDAGLVAQVDETKARVLVAEQKYREANRVIVGAVETLEKGGESATLADALTVQGVVWARLGAHDSSINNLYRALEMAEGVGAAYKRGTVGAHAGRRTRGQATPPSGDLQTLLPRRQAARGHEGRGRPRPAAGMRPPLDT